MAYIHEDKVSGNVIRSSDWNRMGHAIEELDDGKVDRNGDAIAGDFRVSGHLTAALESRFEGSLSVGGNLAIGAAAPGAERLEVAGNLKISGDRIKNAQGYGIVQTDANDWLRINPDKQYPGTEIRKPLSITDGGLSIGELIHVPEGDLRVRGKAAAGSLTVAGALSFGRGEDHAWIRHRNAPDGESGRLEIGIGNDPEDHIVLKPSGNVGIGVDDPQAKLEVAGVVRASVFESTNPSRHRMYPADPLVYQEIFDAKASGAIAKLGFPNYYDEDAYRINDWNGRHMMAFGRGDEEDGNGARVTIPEGFDTVWARVRGHVWNVMKAYFLDGGQEDLGLWTGGHREANCYCPDGSLSDGMHENIPDRGVWTLHEWVPIPVPRAGLLALTSKTQHGVELYFSGLAFSRNPWAHAAQSAVAYHWALNGGVTKPDEITWSSDHWHGDVLAALPPSRTVPLTVPVVPSGRDKLLYLIEQNDNNWNSAHHTGIAVNGEPIERFVATYDNPFARHWNSKSYNRYLAARISADLIPWGARWITVEIDRTKQRSELWFREIGTHDLDVPWS